MKRAHWLIISFIAAAALTGCQDVFRSKPQNAPERRGAVRVSLAMGSPRTAMPTLSETFDYVEFYFLSEGEEQEGSSPADYEPDNNGGYTFLLKPGEYRVEATAFIGGNPVAKGISDKSYTVAENGDEINITINLRPIASEGTGSLKIIFKLDTGDIDDFAINFLSLQSISDDESPPLPVTVIENNEIIDDPPFDCELDTESNPYTLSADAIPAGFYLLQARVAYNGGYAFKTEVIHIGQNLHTSSEYTFKAENGFVPIATMVTTNSDNADDPEPGSLRYALANAPEGSTITVLLEPGAAIELERPLAIDTSLAIEGNGVTITKGNGWNVNDSPLLSIENNANATIARVHFTGGDNAQGDGGAIANNGNLILESCIFSNNKALNGGAIYSGSSSDLSLSVKACTFYGNSASDVSGTSGGAIYCDTDDFTFMGNLFIGNTANKQIVYLDQNGGSLGYNAIDVQFGNNDGEGGWKNDDGTDRYIGTDEINFDDETFSLNNKALVIPPFAGEKYPAKDFYGNAIAFPALAGAVQTGAGTASLILFNSGEQGRMLIDDVKYRYYAIESGDLPKEIDQNIVIGEILTPHDDYPNHHFVGWYNDNDFTDAWDGAAPASGEYITLYARWVDGIPIFDEAGMAGIVDLSESDYFLINDIALNDWEPIAEFYGTFYGENKTITLSGSSGGIFAMVGENGRVENLKVIVNNVTSTYSFGAVAVENYGTIQNCSVSGSVTVTTADPDPDDYDDYYVGGVAGMNYGTVEYCDTAIVVTGVYNVGGVVGVNYSTVQNCFATGDVSGEDFVGGAVGHNNGEAGDAIVSDSYATGNVSGKDSIGGVAGLNSEEGIVSRCYATGSVSGTSDVGGIVGANYDTDSRVENCVALNPRVTLEEPFIYSIARIAGSNLNGTLTNNWARVGMQVIDADGPVADITPDPDDENGADVAYEPSTTVSANWWESGPEWTFDGNSPWEWSAATNLPILKNMPGNPAQDHAVQQ